MDFFEVALTVRLSRYAIVVTYTLFVYDFLVLLDLEYPLIYKARWTLTKCLYLCCRFFPIISGAIIMYSSMPDHDKKDCNTIVTISSILYTLSSCMPQCIYVLRAWAFTGANRWSLFIYLPSLFGYLFFISWLALDNVTYLNTPFLYFQRSGCFKSSPQNAVLDPIRRMLIATIVLDTIVGIHVAIHCYQIQTPRTRLSKLLVTQGLLYFPLMFMLNAIALVLLSTGQFRGYDIFAFSLVFTVSNLMACRFVLEIKEYLDDPVKREITSQVQFAPAENPNDPLSTGGTIEMFELSNRTRSPSQRCRDSVVVT